MKKVKFFDGSSVTVGNQVEYDSIDYDRQVSI